MDISIDPKLLLEKEGNIAVMTLNDPPLNLNNRASTARMIAALDKIEDDPDIDIVVIRANGKYFGAGHDAKEMPSETGKEALDKFDLARTHRSKTFDRMCEMPVVFIAALDQSAYGGAFERALACDILIAAKGVVLNLSEIKFGTFAGAGGIPHLIETVGPNRAIEHMLRANKQTAEEWYRLGIINHVVEEGKAFETAMEIAKEISVMPKTGIRAVKSAVAAFTRLQRETFYPIQEAMSKKLYGDGVLAAHSEKFFKKEGAFK